MEEEEIIKEFGEMWGKAIGNYALIKSDSRNYGYTIMNTVYNSMVVIENDEATKYVIQKLIENGVRVAKTEDEVRNPNRPDPIFYSAEHEAQYRAFQRGEKIGKRKKKK